MHRIYLDRVLGRAVALCMVVAVLAVMLAVVAVNAPVVSQAIVTPAMTSDAAPPHLEPTLPGSRNHVYGHRPRPPTLSPTQAPAQQRAGAVTGPRFRSGTSAGAHIFFGGLFALLLSLAGLVAMAIRRRQW
jgi:hypothetical protein